jgi:murein L,D-transpeptidase YcbB/YkuD
MSKLFLAIALIAVFCIAESCKPQKRVSNVDHLPTDLKGSMNYRSNFPFDSTAIAPFFKSYPELAGYENNVLSIYRKNKYNHIWFDRNGVIEFANSVYSKVQDLDAEGVSSKFPYQDKLEGIFKDEIENTLNETNTEIMLSCMFLFYAQKVYKGVDDKTSTALEWLLPRKQISYSELLDSVMLNPKLLNRDERVLFRQYYKLRDVLQKYREIEKRGGWNPIVLDPKFKSFRPGDTAKAILQIRERLFVTGELKQNNQSGMYDSELREAVKKYQLLNGSKPDSRISKDLVAKMNVPVGDRIKKIIVNMERFRWISPEVIHSDELIFVNIPSFNLMFFRNGKSEFESPVVVGKTMSKTVIFSGKMSYIVFSPYWNLPQSIIKKEVKPGLAKNPNYLEQHNMEWNNGQVRQKPGKKNSLGLVKFMFPNSNDIYLHDTPSKNLFERESRVFSHGCIRVGKPRDLALEILKDDPNWTPAKVDAAMNSGKETSYSLKNKIPVYIGYFTALVNEQGEINFYQDVYDRDDRLAKIIMN